MEAPLHPTPMQRPMMKGKIYVDASNKPTFQGFWGMTHSDVNKSGHTNDFKVVRMESVKDHELGMPVFAGHYQGYFKLTTGFQTETVNESFTLTFRGHSNSGYNVYGSGENRFGKTEIVGTVTQSGKMEIFKMLPGTSTQPDPNEPTPKLPRPNVPRAASPPPPAPSRLAASTPSRAPKSKAGSGKKRTSKKNSSPPPQPNENGLPGYHVRGLKDCLAMLRKSDKNNVFQFPVPPRFRGLKGYYADVIKRPMDLGTVSKQIDTKYRTVKECVEDVRLVFSNAKDFNPDTDPVNALAASLSGKFEAFLSNHRGLLGLDAPGAASVNRNSAPPVPSSASIALSASAGANATGKRIGAPPAVTTTANTSVPTTATPAGPKSEATATSKSPKAAVKALTVPEQDKLATDVNELFRLGNANPSNERAQARVYALWSFAKAYVNDKDRVLVDGGKGSEIRMDALNHVRQRQLRDVVEFFLEDSKNDPAPEETKKETGSGGGTAAGSGKSRSEEGSDAPSRKRSRSDLSEDSDNEEEEQQEQERISPSRRKKDPSGATPGSKGSASGGATALDDEGSDKQKHSSQDSEFGRVDSSSLTLEATASTLKETEIDIDLEDEDDEDDDNKDKADLGNEGLGDSAGGEGAMDEQWSQAQAERKEKEDRERARAEREKALEEQRLRQQAQREKERVEEGLKLSRERAAEKARVEALALEKANREKKQLEEKKEAERVAREEAKASVDLDQVRADSKLMNLMDESMYDD